MKTIVDLRISEKIVPSDNYVIYKCESPEKLPNMFPGQFATIRVDNNKDVFLRRPFSIHDFNEKENTVSFLIKKLGRGSNSLSKLQVGDILNTMLPLGNNFHYNPEFNKKPLLIGGGVGIAPIYFLAKEMHKNNMEFDTLIGGKCCTDILLSDLFTDICKFHCTTEDGSKGTKGFVTHHNIFNTITNYDSIYCCGPEPMMKSIAKVAKENNIFCEVSLENKMACGIGVCLCCVTETKHGNKCVCTTGPVFNINELKW